MVASVVTLSIAARTLGLVTLSAFVLIDALLTLLQAGTFGVTVTVMHRAVAQDVTYRSARAIRSLTLMAALVMLALPLGLAYLGAPHLAGASESQLRGLVLGLALAGALTISTSVDQGLALAQGAYRQMGILEAVGAGLSLTLVILVLPQWGLPTLAFSRLAGAAVSRGGLWVLSMRHHGWAACGLDRPDRAALNLLLRGSAPLLLVTVGVQLVVVTDTLVLESLVTAAAVTTYRLASALPTQIASWTFRGYDVVLPRMARTDSLQVRLAGLDAVSRVFCFAAGLALGFCVVASSLLFHALAGRPSNEGALAMVVFAVLWLINVLIHGPVLLLIADGRQALLSRIVGLEVLGNVVLTVALGSLFGLLGVVLASLAAVVVSNVLVLPRALGREYGFSPLRLLRPGGRASALGCASGSLAGLPFLLVGSEPSERAGTGAAILAGVLATAVVAIVLWRSAGDRHTVLGIVKR